MCLKVEPPFKLICAIEIFDGVLCNAVNSKGALHRLNQMVNRLVNHLVECVHVARSPDRRLKLT